MWYIGDPACFNTVIAQLKKTITDSPLPSSNPLSLDSQSNSMRSLYDTVDGASLLSDDPFEMSYTRSVASQRGSVLTAPSVSSG